jgi:Zn-dependent protease
MNFSFRLGSFPVRVHGSFLVMVLCLGGIGGGSLGGLAQWLVVVFLGVLLHELGHALVGQSFGLIPQIDLIGFGGLTSWAGGGRDARELGPGKRIAISVAGPFTGIAIGLAMRTYVRSRAGMSPFGLTFFDEDTPFTNLTGSIYQVNAFWGLANLLPILPMDGGNVLFQSLNWLTKGKGEKPARIVSAAAAIAAGAGAFLKWHSFYSVFLAGIFAVQNIQALRATSSREKDAPLLELLETGFAAIGQNDAPQAIRIARDVLSRAIDQGVRRDGVRLLAFGYLHSGAWSDLVLLMESAESKRIGDDEMSKFEEAARQLGRPDEADRIAAVRATRRRPKF